jgi:hypothetical protein
VCTALILLKWQDEIFDFLDRVFDPLLDRLGL